MGADNPRQNDRNISEAARRTGEWIVTDPRYQAWAKCKKSDILWLIGKPGSGKSTLLLKLLKESLRPGNALSLQRMLNHCADNEVSMYNQQNLSHSPSCKRNGENVDLVVPKIVASYFYNFRNPNEVDNGRMLQSILFQILWQEPRLFPLFRTTFLQLRVGYEKSISWTFDDFVAIFHSITEHKGFQLCIELFLDAVDESKHSNRVMEILRQQLTGRARSDITIKAIVTRRPIEALYTIPSDRKIQLELHNAIDIEKLIDEGVEKIEEALQNFSNRVNFYQHKLVEFQDKLKERAGGVVLWVSVALTSVLNSSVRGEFTVDSMMKTLDALPSNLEELYAHIIYRLQEQKKEDVEKVKHRLNWTTHSGRVLTVNEFFHAIALSENFRATYTAQFQLEDVIIPHMYIEGVRTTLSSSCGGLLEVQAPRSETGLFDPEKFFIQLIHRSVRTFLETEAAGPFRAVKQECNLKITETCTHYLRVSLIYHRNTQDSVAFVQHLGRHSLLAYIWTELPTHLLDLDQNDLSKRLQELSSLLQELRNIGPGHPGFLILHTWTLRLLTQMPSKQDDIEQWKAETRSGLTRSKNTIPRAGGARTLFRSWLVRVLGTSAAPSHGIVNLQMFLRNILVAAIEANNFPALRIICNAGALSCDEKDKILSAALETATRTNNPAALDCIGGYRTAIDPTSSGMLKDTFKEALETACKNGYEAVTRWLLDIGTISAIEDQGCTAIYLAVSFGHDLVVELLLKYGISPHYERKDARSLLWVAAVRGYQKVVRVLLQFGANPNGADDQNRTPLAMALEADHEAVVKILWPLTTKDTVIANSRPTLLFLMPKERNPTFVGRADVLRSLEDAFKSQMIRIALVGLGGSG